MPKKNSLLALCAFVSIPIVIGTGAVISGAIDPEIATRTANYERNFQLLHSLKAWIFYASLALGVALAVLTVYFFFKGREASTEPLGRRILRELLFLVGASAFSYGAVVIKRHLWIALEAFRQNTSAAEIIRQQTASSGMWAFGEAVEFLFLFASLYVLRPFLAAAWKRLFRR